MSNGKLPERVQALLDQYASADRSLVLALHALFGSAREDGTTDLDSLTRSEEHTSELQSPC